MYYYHLTVEFEDRRAVTFAVNRGDYDSLSVGSKGVVEYAGKHFRKFHVGKTLAELVNPDKKSRDYRQGFKKNTDKKAPEYRRYKYKHGRGDEKRDRGDNTGNRYE